MSNNLGLPLLTAGSFAEHPFNDAVYGIDAALSEPASVNLVPANFSITTPQWRGIGFFSANPGGNAGRRLNVPAIKGARIFHNASSLQSFNVVSGQTVITIAALETAMIYNTGVSGGIFRLISTAAAVTGPVPESSSDFVAGVHTLGGSASSYGALYTDPGSGLSSPTRDSNGMHHSTGTGSDEGVDFTTALKGALIGTGLARTVYMEFVCPATPANKIMRFAVVDGSNSFYLDIYDDGNPRYELQNATGLFGGLATDAWVAGTTVKLAFTIYFSGGVDRLIISTNGSAFFPQNMHYTGTFAAGNVTISFAGGSPAGGPKLLKFNVYDGLFGTDLQDLTT